MATNGNEPMTDEQHAFAVAGFRSVFDQRFLFADEQRRIVELAERLLAENQRLRAREQALAAEIAAMRPMVEALSCLNEAGSRIEPAAAYYALEVEPLIEEAQQFVAAHPAAGEAESEGE